MALASSPLRRWLAPLFVVACTLAAFLNSLDGEFLSDDFCEILDNPRMDSLWPPWPAMLVGNDLPSRPLPYLTFAIDHAIWGDRAFGFHLTNLAVHVTAALAVFFLTRTTLRLPRLHDTNSRHADVLAVLVAAIWAVHPLNTQAVTYIYQRMESLTAMFCLVSLAAFATAVARGWDARWLAGSVAASAAAMFSKETAVVLPLLIASYDWLFCGEPSPPPGRRRRFYTALCSTWLVILVQLVVQSRRYSATGAFDVSPLAYFLTQPRVILQYLRLAFWPTQLCFDRRLPLLTAWSDILPSLGYVAALGSVATYGLVRRRAWAWPGVAFFLALAPSSSFLPLGAVTEEYRMYLALAAVTAAVVLGGHAVIRHWTPPGTARDAALGAGTALAIAAIAILIGLTQERNRVYAMPGGVWLDVVEQGRGSTRAIWNLAIACDFHGDTSAALGHADSVFAINRDLDIYEHLARRRLWHADPATAERYLRHATEARAEQIAAGQPLAMQTVALLAIVLDAQDKSGEAEAIAAAELERVRAAIGDDAPESIGLMAIHASGLMRTGDTDAAKRLARIAASRVLGASQPAGPSDTTVADRLARLLRELGLVEEALRIDRRGSST